MTVPPIGDDIEYLVQQAERNAALGFYDVACAALEDIASRHPERMDLILRIDELRAAQRAAGAVVPAPPPPAPPEPEPGPEIDLLAAIGPDPELILEHLLEGDLFRRYGMFDRAAQNYEAILAVAPD